MITTKEKVLEILLNNRDRFISGQEIANMLSLSRMGINTAITALRKLGYEIEAVSNKGYKLADTCDILSEIGIRAKLKHPVSVSCFDVFDGSTNDFAKLSDIPENSVALAVIAGGQTGGKGRNGRVFQSPEGLQICLSLLLKPKKDIQDNVLITTAASVAVARTIKSLTEKQPQIKWVNDVYIGGKKICGILTEAVTNMENGEMSKLVVGIGVNFYITKFPEDIKDIAGSVFTSRPTIYRDEFTAVLINNLIDIFDNISSREFIADYKNLSYIIGKEINIIAGENITPATATDINDDGHLIVKTDTGETKTLSTGEVSVRLK